MGSSLLFINSIIHYNADYSGVRDIHQPHWQVREYWYWICHCDVYDFDCDSLLILLRGYSRIIYQYSSLYCDKIVLLGSRLGVLYRDNNILCIYLRNAVCFFQENKLQGKDPISKPQKPNKCPQYVQLTYESLPWWNHHYWQRPCCLYKQANLQNSEYRPRPIHSRLARAILRPLVPVVRNSAYFQIERRSDSQTQNDRNWNHEQSLIESTTLMWKLQPWPPTHRCF